ncbi:hypothetical protein LJC27_06530 [Christensenellaceae bacterium OttesenSCG-928-M15]|nr:hypothetical protein [Christensenellaceae bacterium OttesenSCG-928-M15]
MKKIGSFLLVLLLLLLTLAPTTALADGTTGDIIILTTAGRTDVPGDKIAGSELSADLSAAYAWAIDGSGGNISAGNIVALVVTKNYTLSNAIPSVGSKPVVINNATLTIDDGGVVNNDVIVLGNGGIVVQGTGKLTYAVNDANGAAGNFTVGATADIRLSAGAKFTMAPRSLSALGLADPLEDGTAIAAFNAAVVSYGFTFGGAITIADDIAFSNSDRIEVKSGAVVTTSTSPEKSIAVTDNAILTNNGTITGHRIRTGDAWGYPTNVPTIINNGTISTNKIRIKPGGKLINNGSINNSGGTVDFEDGAVLENNGSIVVDVFESRDGTADVPAGMTALENRPNEVINKSGANITATTITNTLGEITNYGTIDATTIDNTGNGVINNYGGDISGAVSGSNIVELSSGISWGGASAMTYSARASQATWTGGSLEITSVGNYSDFEALYVDDKLVDPKHYTAAPGSTVLTIDEAVLRALAPGKHTFRLRFDHGNSYVTVTTAAIIVAPDVAVATPPKVGPSLTALGLLFLGFALAAVVLRRKVKA